MKKPGTYNIVVHDRTTLTVVFLLKDETDNAIDLSNYTAKAVANGDVSWLPSGVYDLAPTVTDALAGEITISKTAAETAVLSEGEGSVPKWDLVIVHTPTGVASKILQGTFTVRETQTP
jgi:hypothetical protein